MKTLTIERLAHAGDGEGEGVFAPFTLPGETVRGAVDGGRMENPEIITPADERAAPPCRHFTICGGCALQHASDAFTAAWKRDRIAAALASQGFSGVEIRETVTSPARSRRRAGFTARRTKKTILAGFHERRGADIIAIEDCHLLAPGLLSALDAVRDAARLGASRKGEIRAMATLSEAGTDLSIDGAKELERSALSEAAALAEAHDLARLCWNGQVVAERRAPAQRFGRALVTPPPGAFLQATAEGEAALVNAAREAVGSAARIADLFAGCGAFALPLAENAEVLAVEGDEAMTAALTAGWRAAPGLKKLVAKARDLFRRPLLAEELKGLDAVVIDPPRAGAQAQCGELVKGGPARIASISCNPATFARDARILADGGYKLDWVLPVDQFRWSAHVELAAQFTRR